MTTEENILPNNKKLCRRKLIRFHDGYLRIHKPEHRFADYKGNVFLHRVVYEHFHKCCLLPWTEIHHINGIRTDNHKRNMMAVSHAEHRRLHMKKDMSGRICLICKSNTTYTDKKGHSQWFIHKGSFVCIRCHWKGKTKKWMNIYL